VDSFASSWVLLDKRKRKVRAEGFELFVQRDAEPANLVPMNQCGAVCELPTKAL
jgi:hypothetical protein